LKKHDPKLNLTLTRPQKKREVLNVALSNTFGIGGTNNACLIFKKKLANSKLMKRFFHLFNSHFQKGWEFFLGMKKILGFKPKNLEIYQKAFRTSFCQNRKGQRGLPMNLRALGLFRDAML